MIDISQYCNKEELLKTVKDAVWDCIGWVDLPDKTKMLFNEELANYIIRSIDRETQYTREDADLTYYCEQMNLVGIDLNDCCYQRTAVGLTPIGPITEGDMYLALLRSNSKVYEIGEEIDDQGVRGWKIYETGISKDILPYIGETVFFDRAKAEKKISELSTANPIHAVSAGYLGILNAEIRLSANDLDEIPMPF